MPRRPLVLLVPMLAAGVLAAPASAATVSQITRDSCNGVPECEKYQAGFPVPVTSLAAAPGEANRVTITREGEEFVLTDAGAPVVALAPCTQVDASTVRCPFTAGIDDIAGLAIDAGDGADEVTITGDPGAESVLAGGLGDDAITGGEGNDTIDGGPGDDRLAGGGGLDTLTYARPTSGVEVDLRRAPAAWPARRTPCRASAP